MAKILDSTALNGQIQKVVELSQGYIINGHYYDKAQMIPKPLQAFNILGNAADIGMTQRLSIKHNYPIHSKTQGDIVVIDRYDPTICYVWNAATRSNNATIFKFKESNGTISLVNSYVWGAVPTAYATPRACIGQDANYLYYIIGGTTNWTEAIHKIDKITLTSAGTIDGNATYAWASALMETDSYIYYGRRTGYGTCAIKRWNKTGQVSEPIITVARTSNIYFSANWSNLYVVSPTEQYSYTVYHNQASNIFKIVRYKLDPTQASAANVMTEADAEITWGSVTAFPVFTSSTTFHYESFITTAQNGKSYLNVMVYEVNGSTIANIPAYGIYTFLIDPTTKDLTFKNFFNVSNSDMIRGFIGVNNNTFLTVPTDSSTLFLSFDQANERFGITDSIGNQPTHIGADLAGNIWVVNSTSEIEYFSPYVPTNVYVNYELDAYQYQGLDINTYITIEAKNFTGTNIAANLQLTLKGNAVFTSTGTKVLSDTTSLAGPKQIPVTIKGSGSITVYPQLLM